MSEQEKKQQRIYALLNTETKPKFLCLQSKEKKIFTAKKLFKEKGSWRLNKKIRRRLFNCSCYSD